MAGMSQTSEDVLTVLTITPAARSTVLDVLRSEPEAESLALWLEIAGEADGAYR